MSNNIECQVEYQGLIETKRFYKNGVLHNENGPAVITTNGAKHWYINGKLHRDDGPALICPMGSKYWYKNGLKHREDGPAVIERTYEAWYIDGKLHREDGPAMVHTNGVEHWYINGLHHREDGPAVIQENYKAWYINGKLHRLDGPASESSSFKNYYIFGNEYSEDNYKKMLKLIRRFSNNLKNKYRKKLMNALYATSIMCKDVCGIVSQYMI